MFIISAIIVDMEGKDEIDLNILKNRLTKLIYSEQDTFFFKLYGLLSENLSLNYLEK